MVNQVTLFHNEKVLLVPGMIQVTRLNDKGFVVNCELIKFIESTPDTLITLSTGEKLMVKESVDVVVAATMDYRKRLYQEKPGTSPASSGVAAKER